MSEDVTANKPPVRETGERKRGLSTEDNVRRKAETLIEICGYSVYKGDPYNWFVDEPNSPDHRYYGTLLDALLHGVMPLLVSSREHGKARSQGIMALQEIRAAVTSAAEQIRQAVGRL